MRRQSAGKPQVAPLWCRLCRDDCDWCPVDRVFPQESAGKPLVAPGER